MGKEGSVAPKERVNIVYKPATGGASEEKELPLKLLMLGDYTLRKDETPLEDRKPIAVDKNNFNDVMKSQKLGLDVNVDNTLTEDDTEDELACSLKFETLKDFGPESVARQVPALNQLLELREALTALKGPLGNIPAFRKQIQSMIGDEESRKKILDDISKATEGGEEGGE
jgi:type VI secretion system protein ImpB